MRAETREKGLGFGVEQHEVLANGLFSRGDVMLQKDEALSSSDERESPGCVVIGVMIGGCV